MSKFVLYGESRTQRGNGLGSLAASFPSFFSLFSAVILSGGRQKRKAKGGHDGKAKEEQKGNLSRAGEIREKGKFAKLGTDGQCTPWDRATVWLPS